MKRIIAILLSILTVFSVVCFNSIHTSAATSTPSFGSTQSSFTLYINDSNNDYRTVNIPVNNWKSGYTYTASSNKTSVVAIERASVNSKTGVTFNAKAKGLGNAVITVQMKKSNKVITKKSISITVSSRGLSTPTSLRLVSSTKNSIKVSYSLDNKSYVDGYRFEVSTSSSFPSNNKKVYVVNSKNQMSTTLNNLNKGTRYYVRIAAISTRNGCILRSNWSSAIRVITKS